MFNRLGAKSTYTLKVFDRRWRFSPKTPLPWYATICYLVKRSVFSEGDFIRDITILLTSLTTFYTIYFVWLDNFTMVQMSC